MIKKQIWEISFIANYKFGLSADICKSITQFKQKTSYVFCYGILQISFIVSSFQHKKVKPVWVFQYTCCKLALICGQLRSKVSYGFSLLAKITIVYNIFQFTFAKPLIYYACHIVERFFYGFAF